jgi:hypothetical protein
MIQHHRDIPLSPSALAFAFAVFALLAALAMGLPAVFGMGSMMWGAHDGGHMGGGSFGLLGLVWTVFIGALGGAITAWIYNAIVGEQTTDTSDVPAPPDASRPAQPRGPVPLPARVSHTPRVAIDKESLDDDD